jgi:predicted AAA+ superfamily ATPase
MFKRKLYDKLLKWKETSDGKTALLIEGPRRVGKTTLVKEFAKNEYKSAIIINFMEASPLVKNLFDDLSDLNYLFLQLQLQYKTSLETRKSLIVFDEVQLCPRARQAIKTLVQDGRYDYIETGSLISIRKNIKDIVIPSEELHISMYPMDYEEFLWAKGDTVTIPLLQQCFSNRQTLGEQLNRKLMRDFRLYMLVGGMPQAVKEYLSTNDFIRIDRVKRNILNLYEDDFRKIDSTGKMSLLFNSIPAQLSHSTSRYHVSQVLKGQRAGDLLSIFSELQDSKTVSFAYSVNDPNVGLAATMNLEKFKIYLADTGLFVTLMFKDKDFTDNIIYDKLLNDKLSANLGYLYENVVAQMLTSAGNKLYYCSFNYKQLKHSFEIDFLLSRKNKLCPIEVKSSGYNTHKSLDIFGEKYKKRIAEKYLITVKDLHEEFSLLSLPVYMTQFM